MPRRRSRSKSKTTRRRTSTGNRTVPKFGVGFRFSNTATGTTPIAVPGKFGSGFNFGDSKSTVNVAALQSQYVTTTQK